MKVAYRNYRFAGSVERPECWVDAKWFFSDRDMLEDNPPFPHLRPVRPFQTISMGVFEEIDPPGRSFTETFGLWGAGTLAALKFPG